MNPTDWIVAVGYCENGVGRSMLRYAADLAARLSGTLLVALPYRRAELALASSAAGMTGDGMLAETRTRVSARLDSLGITRTARQVMCLPADVDDACKPHAQIAVGDVGGCLTADAKVHPADETHVQRGRGPLKLLVPHGNGRSGPQAMAFASALAAGLRAEIGIYHTTWREGHVASGDPRDHMCKDARDVNAEMLRMADAVRLRERSVIETADDVSEGIIRAAYDGKYAMIAMARSSHILRGSHVTKVTHCSAIPVIEVLAEGDPR